jgi:hypothetical protein
MATTSTAEALFEENRKKIVTLGAWRLCAAPNYACLFVRIRVFVSPNKEKKHFVHFQAAQRA